MCAMLIWRCGCDISVYVYMYICMSACSAIVGVHPIMGSCIHERKSINHPHTRKNQPPPGYQFRPPPGIISTTPGYLVGRPTCSLPLEPSKLPMSAPDSASSTTTCTRVMRVMCHVNYARQCAFYAPPPSPSLGGRVVAWVVG